MHGELMTAYVDVLLQARVVDMHWTVDCNHFFTHEVLCSLEQAPALNWRRSPFLEKNR